MKVFRRKDDNSLFVTNGGLGAFRGIQVVYLTGEEEGNVSEIFDIKNESEYERDATKEEEIFFLMKRYKIKDLKDLKDLGYI